MWVIGHRGAAGHAPENTMAAFRRAVELGATFIETDLQISRDARLVCIHDDTLDRTTNGRGAVHALTLAELRELDAGAWRGREFAGERIPTVEEVLAFAREAEAKAYLELKAPKAWGAAQTLVGAIAEAQAAARVVVISFDAETIESVHRQEPTMVTGLLFDRARRDIIEHAVNVGARQILPRGDLVTRELLAEARRAGLKIVTWTIDRAKDLEQLIAAGVDGIITDYPDRLVAALKS